MQAHPAPSRSFPVYFQDGEVVYPEFAYPLRHEIVSPTLSANICASAATPSASKKLLTSITQVPIWLAALLAAIIPIVIILFMQIRIRSFWVRLGPTGVYDIILMERRMLTMQSLACFTP